MNTETRTDERTELDQRTKDELQPPCDAGSVPCYCSLCGGNVTGVHSCSAPATWIARKRCTGCPPILTLCCEPHARQAIRADSEACLSCHGEAKRWMEPLR